MRSACSHVLAAERSHHHDRGRLAQPVVVPDAPGRLEPVHARHTPVHEDQVVRHVDVALAHGLYRFGTGTDQVYLPGHALQGV